MDRCSDLDCRKPLTGSRYPAVEGRLYCEGCYPKYRNRADRSIDYANELRTGLADYRGLQSGKYGPRKRNIGE